MSLGTVKAHVTRVLMKLELDNRVQVALLAHDALSPTDGACSLREATLAANSDSASGGVADECVAGSGPDTIELPAGTYTLSIARPIPTARTC